MNYLHYSGVMPVTTHVPLLVAALFLWRFSFFFYIFHPKWAFSACSVTFNLNLTATQHTAEWFPQQNQTQKVSFKYQLLLLIATQVTNTESLNVFSNSSVRSDQNSTKPRMNEPWLTAIYHISLKTAWALYVTYWLTGSHYVYRTLRKPSSWTNLTITALYHNYPTYTLSVFTPLHYV